VLKRFKATELGICYINRLVPELVLIIIKNLDPVISANFTCTSRQSICSITRLTERSSCGKDSMSARAYMNTPRTETCWPTFSQTRYLSAPDITVAIASSLPGGCSSSFSGECDMAMNNNTITTRPSSTKVFQTETTRRRRTSS
jgi:hypothetical protein